MLAERLSQAHRSSTEVDLVREQEGYGTLTLGFAWSTGKITPHSRMEASLHRQKDEQTPQHLIYFGSIQQGPRRVWVHIFGREVPDMQRQGLQVFTTRKIREWKVIGPVAKDSWGIRAALAKANQEAHDIMKSLQPLEEA
jgi:hypothetical protein